MRVLLFITTSLLFLPGVFNLNTLQAQNEQEFAKPGQLDLELKLAKWNGNPVKYDTLQTHHLQKGENLIVVYQNEKVAYLIQLIYKRTESKINLSIRPIAETAKGKQHYGKMVKNHHEITDSKTPMRGELNETITYDNKTLSTCQVAFKYILQ